MSYTPTTWATGDVITAEKLNNMEAGIAGAGGGVSSNVVIYDFTVENQSTVITEAEVPEIIANIESGKICVAAINIDGTKSYAILESGDMMNVSGKRITMYLTGQDTGLIIQMSLEGGYYGNASVWSIEYLYAHVSMS